MRTLIAAVALAAAVAVPPALAQLATYTTTPHYASAPYAYAPYGAPQDDRAYGASAAYHTDHTVYFNGKIIGQDPDPSVRFEMRRDYGWQKGADYR